MSEELVIAKASVGYGGRRVLKRLTLPSVPAGTVVGLLGANGAGKSTLLKLIAGLVRGSGKLNLGSRDLLRLDPATRAQLVGYLPQSLMRPSTLLVYEVLVSALRATRPGLDRATAEHRIDSVLRAVSITDLALKPLASLSGGQRQLAGLAQILVREPRLMLLDEPTSALDLRWQLAALQHVRAQVQRHDAIALVALHDINLALRFCDQLVILGDGLLAAGAPDEVLTPGVLRQAFGVEARVESCSRGRPVVLTDGVAAQAERDRITYP